jgi:hypothetical protein
MQAGTRQLVRDRAAGRCEYCRLPESADEWPFHVDHIIARVHGGGDDLENLSWSCTQCNLHKATNFASVDRVTGKRVDLFNPRGNAWSAHFRVALDGTIVGLTPTGRATVQLLNINGIPQLDLRRELIQQGVYIID